MIKQLSHSFKTPLLAVLSGFLVGAIIMLIFGYDPLQNYLSLFVGAFGDIYSIGETLRNMVPLLLVALGFAISSKAGFFNIGGPGQYLFGWFATIAFALKFAALPGWLLIILATLCGAIAGGIWSGIAGILRAFFGTNEVISTIMLNYIALYYINYAIKNWLSVDHGDSSATIATKASLRTPFLQDITNGSTFHWGFFIAIIVAVIVWYYLNHTTSGYEIKSIGLNEVAANYAGMNVKKAIITSMIISGILAGLGGALDGLGNFQNISISSSLPPVGFNGMAVALLAAENPLGAILAALLFSALQVGGLSISVETNTPAEIVNIVIAAIIFFVGIKYIFTIFNKKKSLSQKEAAK